MRRLQNEGDDAHDTYRRQQADEATPMIVVRGLTWSPKASSAAQLLRDPKDDLFR